MAPWALAHQVLPLPGVKEIWGVEGPGREEVDAPLPARCSLSLDLEGLLSGALCPQGFGSRGWESTGRWDLQTGLPGPLGFSRPVSGGPPGAGGQKGGCSIAPPPVSKGLYSGPQANLCLKKGFLN